MNSVVQELIRQRIAMLVEEIDARKDELELLKDSVKPTDPAPIKKPHWASTPEGRAKLRKQSRAYWRKKAKGKK